MLKSVGKEKIVKKRRRRSRLFRVKVLAICVTAVFVIAGVRETLVKEHSDTNKEKVLETSPNIEEAERGTVAVKVNVTGDEAKCRDAYLTKQNTSKPSMDWGAEDDYLLAKIAMAEAEGEDTEGKALVILVVLNRVWSDSFPETIGEVIYQENQFSPVSNGRFDNIEPNEDCYRALHMVKAEKWDKSQGATYFESKSQSTWHQESLQFLFKHGNHYFYIDKEQAE